MRSDPVHVQHVFHEILHVVLRIRRKLQWFIYLIGGTDPRPVPEEDLQFAQAIIENFVANVIHLQAGNGLQTSYHLILHVTADCRRQQCHYDVISTWVYENETRYMNRYLVSGNCKAEQFRNRVMEADTFLFNRDESGRILRDKSGEPATGWGGVAIGESPVADFSFDCSGRYKRVVFKGFLISTALPDSFCLIKDHVRLPKGGGRRVFQVTDVKERVSDGALFVFGHLYRKKTKLFDAPEDSTRKQVYAFSEKSPTVVGFPIQSVVGKLYAFPRFAKLTSQSGPGKITKADVGGRFERVDAWVGVALRHLSATCNDSLY